VTNILHIDASARTSRSLSRDLSRLFSATWREKRPNDIFVIRDVGREPPPTISEDWIAAVFTKPDQRSAVQNDLVKLSDSLIDELAKADVIVLGSPMYNYGLPAALKAWVDQVVRVDKTFTFDLKRGDFPLEPILSGKSLVLLSSCGEFGFEPGGIRAHMNHFDTHLRAIKHYLGVNKMFHIAIEYQEFGDERHAVSIAAAKKQVIELVDKVVSENQLT
jgi:FMN-dependent NADH-azoreductase